MYTKERYGGGESGGKEWRGMIFRGKTYLENLDR